MKQEIAHVALVAHDYDEAIEFFTQKLDLTLAEDDFWRDYNKMKSRGIEFVREPATEAYGTVVVFKDLYGNLWDFVQYSA